MKLRDARWGPSLGRTGVRRTQPSRSWVSPQAESFSQAWRKKRAGRAVGARDAISFPIDYRPLKRADLKAGPMVKRLRVGKRFPACASSSDPLAVRKKRANFPYSGAGCSLPRRGRPSAQKSVPSVARQNDRAPGSGTGRGAWRAHSPARSHQAIGMSRRLTGWSPLSGRRQ